MEVLRKYSILLLIVVFASCGEKADTPQIALDSFLNACASADTFKVSRISTIDIYPLVTSWEVRRITSPKILGEFKYDALVDTLSIIEVRLTQALKYNSLAEDTISLHDRLWKQLEESKAEYKEAQAEYDEAHADLERAKKYSYGVSEALDEAVKWRRIRDIRYETYLSQNSKMKKYSKYDYRGLDSRHKRVKEEVLNLESSYMEFDRFKNVIEKSIGEFDSGLDYNIESLSAIVDLQIPSLGGILLNKKYNIQMMRAICSECNSKYIISKLTDLSDDIEE